MSSKPEQLLIGCQTILVSEIFLHFFRGERESKIESLCFSATARFGKLATMKRSVREIGLEMFNPKLQTVNVVFTTLDNAVDLLQYVFYAIIAGQKLPLSSF